MGSNGATLLGALLLPGAAGLLATLPAGVPRPGRWLAVASLASFFLLVQFGAGGFQTVWPWAPELGLEWAFRLDRLAWVFGLLITGVGGLAALYADAYLHDGVRRFFAVLGLFTTAMLGLVLADNVFVLFLFWEGTSVASFLLIGHDREREAARRAARQSLLVTAGAGLALLAGLVVLAAQTGTSTISAMTAAPLAPAAFACILAGAFAKSAQFPMHFWLPNAMEAPTPVSALLHSATMVQGGVYLLARLFPVLGSNPLWATWLTGFGLATVVVGVALTLFSRDLKRILAYSTISALGLFVLAIGQGRMEALLPLLVAHALYKAALFFVAGSLAHATDERDATRLSGLGRAMPWTAVAAFVAAFSMAGLFPSAGFAAKETLVHGGGSWALAGALLYAAGNVVAAYAVGLRPFIGKPSHSAHEGGFGMVAGPLALGAAGLAAAFLGGGWAWSLGSAATAWSAWPLSVPWLSLIALALGAGLAWAWERRLARIELPSFGPAAAFEALLLGLDRLGPALSRLIQHGELNRYLRASVAVITAAGLWALFRYGGPHVSLPAFDANWYEVAIAVAIMGGAFAGAQSASRLGAVACLGIVGTGVALIYALYGAPDLAMTQVAVETLTLLLFVFAFARLPKTIRPVVRRVRWFDVGLSMAVGGLVTTLTLLANATPPPSTVSEEFVARSFTEGHGRNVVNVILVDFRGFDTLGEITVLAMAAIGVFALLKRSGHRGGVA